jgi:hypothetical protein
VLLRVLVGAPCNPQTHRQEDREFEAFLGYTARLSQKDSPPVPTKKSAGEFGDPGFKLNRVGAL